MGSLISICIPSYNRPSLLRKSIESCFAQTYTDYEILIGDDSGDNLSAIVVEELDRLKPGKIKYSRNVPPLRQNANVNTLFKRANGDRLVLLHDDDILLPSALADLSSCWNEHPYLSGAFGLQNVIDMQGNLLEQETKRTNEFYLRVPRKPGLLNVPELAGILRMLPNNGYMILTKKAQQIGYRSFDDVGGACDFDFGLRFCLDDASLYFIDKYVSSYRVSDDAISLGANDAPVILKILKLTKVPSVAEAGRQSAIRHFTPSAASGFARKGDGLSSLKLLLSSDYPFNERFTIRFIFHCLLAFAAVVGGKSGAAFVLRILKNKVRQ